MRFHPLAKKTGLQVPVLSCNYTAYKNRVHDPLDSLAHVFHATVDQRSYMCSSRVSFTWRMVYKNENEFVCLDEAEQIGVLLLGKRIEVMKMYQSVASKNTLYSQTSQKCSYFILFATGFPIDYYLFDDCEYFQN